MDSSTAAYEAKLMQPLNLVSKTVSKERLTTTSREKLGIVNLTNEASPFRNDYTVSRYPITGGRMTGLSSIRDCTQVNSIQETDRKARDMIGARYPNGMERNKSAEAKKIPRKRNTKSPSTSQRPRSKSKSKSPIQLTPTPTLNGKKDQTNKSIKDPEPFTVSKPTKRKSSRSKTRVD